MMVFNDSTKVARSEDESETTTEANTAETRPRSPIEETDIDDQTLGVCPNCTGTVRTSGIETVCEACGLVVDEYLIDHDMEPSMPRTAHPLMQLETDRRTIKRAQYEAFEFSLTDRGVLVRNASHENPANHAYLVTIEDGLPATCECPADEHYPRACKHRIAVAIRPCILDAAIAAYTVQELIARGSRSQSTPPAP